MVHAGSTIRTSLVQPPTPYTLVHLEYTQGALPKAADFRITEPAIWFYCEKQSAMVTQVEAGLRNA